MSNLFEISKKRVLEFTGIDVSKVYDIRVRDVVEAKFIFIAVLSKYFEPDNYPYSKVGEYIHLNRSTISVHHKNYLENNKVTPEISKKIDQIYILVESDLIKNEVEEISIQNILESYLIKIKTEEKRINLLLQEIHRTRKKINVFEVIRLYNSGFSCIEVGQKVGISKQYVLDILVNNNIPRRTPHRWHKKKQLDVA